MRTLLIMTVALLLSTSCATTMGKHSTTSAIGPYTEFSGRLIVIEPKRRWQVTVQWRGTADSGEVRLIHAATQRIIELHWQGEQLSLRDNQQVMPSWRSVSREQLASYGIILPPQQLAGILAGKIPPSLHEKSEGEWEGRLNGSFLKMKWISSAHRLEIMDISKGRQATLIIQP